MRFSPLVIYVPTMSRKAKKGDSNCLGVSVVSRIICISAIKTSLKESFGMYEKWRKKRARLDWTCVDIFIRSPEPEEDEEKSLCCAIRRHYRRQSGEKIALLFRVWNQLQAGKIFVGGLKSSIPPVCKSNITPFPFSFSPFHSIPFPHSYKTTSSHHLLASLLFCSGYTTRLEQQVRTTDSALSCLCLLFCLCLCHAMLSTLDPTLWPSSAVLDVVPYEQIENCSIQWDSQTFQIKYKCVR